MKEERQDSRPSCLAFEVGGVIEDAVEDDAVKVGEAAATTGHDTDFV